MLIRSLYAVVTAVLLLSQSLSFSANRPKPAKKPSTVLEENFKRCEPLLHYFKQAPSPAVKEQEYQKFIESIYTDNLDVFKCVEHVLQQKKKKRINEIKTIVREVDPIIEKVLDSQLKKAQAFSARIVIDTVECDKDIPEDVCALVKEKVKIFNERRLKKVGNGPVIKKKLTVVLPDNSLEHETAAAYSGVDGFFSAIDFSNYMLRLSPYFFKQSSFVLHSTVDHELEHLFKGDHLIRLVFKQAFFSRPLSNPQLSLLEQIGLFHVLYKTGSKFMHIQENAADGIPAASSLKNAYWCKEKFKYLLKNNIGVEGYTHPANAYRLHQATVIYDLKKVEHFHMLEQQRLAEAAKQKEEAHVKQFDDFRYSTV